MTNEEQYDNALQDTARSDATDVRLSEGSMEALADARPGASELVDTAPTLEESVDSVSDSADEGLTPEAADSALIQRSAEAQATWTLMTDATALLFTDSSELSRQLTDLMGRLSTETDASTEADLIRELAVYTAASRVRATLLAPMDSSETTSIQDYEQLGFVGVEDHNRALVDTLVSRALLDGNDGVDISTQVAESLRQFEILRTWALQDGETEETIVTVDPDISAQLDKVAEKLDVLFPHSDYDDTLVDFLTEQMAGDEERYVFASMDAPNGSALLSAVELPVTQLSELLSAGSILIEGRDGEGRWQSLSEVVAVEGDSGVIALNASYQGFSGFRVSASNNVSAELRGALVGTTVSFETRELESEPLVSPLEGVEHLAALPPSLAAQLLSWSGADAWSDYVELNQVLPTFSALQEGYETFYGGTPDADALRSMLRLSLSLPPVEGSVSSTLQASVGDFGWSDIEVLTGVELVSDAEVAVLLSELSAAYASDEGVEAVVSALHHKAWLAESEGLLNESFDELATRVFALSNDDMNDAGVLQEVVRLSSVIKFKQLLEGSEVELSAEDVTHFGLGELAEGQLAGFTRYLATQASAVRAGEMDLNDVLGAFVIEQADAQIALDALLAGPSWVEREVTVNTDGSLSRLLGLLSAEYGDNSAVYSGLVTAILGAVSSIERTLATIASGDEPMEYVELLDASGERLGTLPEVSIRCYRDAADVEGELLSLIAVPGELGRFTLPDMAADFSRVDLVATGYHEAVQQIASVRVMGEAYSLTAAHLAALGFDNFETEDIPQLYQLASAMMTQNSDLTVELLLETYQQLKPFYDWQDATIAADTWRGLGVDLDIEQLAASLAGDQVRGDLSESVEANQEISQSPSLEQIYSRGDIFEDVLGFGWDESLSLIDETFRVPSVNGKAYLQDIGSLWQDLVDGTDEVELVSKDENSVVWGDDLTLSSVMRTQLNVDSSEPLSSVLPHAFDNQLGLGDLAGVDFSWLEQQSGSGELQ